MQIFGVAGVEIAGRFIAQQYLGLVDKSTGHGGALALATAELRTLSFACLAFNGLQSTVTAVPEPAQWGLLLGGVGLLAALRRRKASCSAR